VNQKKHEKQRDDDANIEQHVEEKGCARNSIISESKRIPNKNPFQVEDRIRAI
jgi:hypothetical protein